MRERELVELFKQPAHLIQNSSLGPEKKPRLYPNEIKFLNSVTWCYSPWDCLKISRNVEVYEERMRQSSTSPSLELGRAMIDSGFSRS